METNKTGVTTQTIDSKIFSTNKIVSALHKGDFNT